MIWGYWEPKNSKHYITPILGPLCKVLKLVRNHTVAQKVKWHWPSQIIQRFMKETSTGQLDGSLWDNSYCTKRKFSDPKSVDWKCRPKNVQCDVFQSIEFLQRILQMSVQSILVFRDISHKNYFIPDGNTMIQ